MDLVVLPTTVVDARGHFVDGLHEDNFRVSEDHVPQKISVFKREDIPVSMGLVIDDSGSMRDKRPQVNAAALALVQASNPNDEAFVVNFNDDYYLDTEKDFTNSVPEMKEALEGIKVGGETALYDAIIGSLDHLKKGTKQKKVLLVITDGYDNASRYSLEQTVREVQSSNVVIYTVGLLSDNDDKKERRQGRMALTQIAKASGGMAFFPETTDDVGAVCTQIARDIRDQYTLAYYPTNDKRDGTFRIVHVEVFPPRGYGKLSARTRNGYFAPGPEAQAQSKGQGD